jgi:putative MATE family efflux protein
MMSLFFRTFRKVGLVMQQFTDTKKAVSSETGTPLAVGRLRSIWRDVRLAVRGTEQDFTEGGLGRAIVLLSIPMVLEMVMESVFAIVDVFFVSKLGPDAVATVGVTESVLTLVYAISIGFGMGTTALVARRIGEKRPREAAVTTVQAIAVGLLASLPIAIIGLSLPRQLLGAMGMDPAVAEANAGFTAVLLGGNAVIMLLFIINAAFRSAGDAAVAMRVLWLANGLNIVLDPCLIFGLGPFPELGITGAAVATTIGRGTGVLFQLWLLFRRTGRIRITREDLRLAPRVMATLARVSLGGIGQFAISTSSWIGLMRIMAVFGAESLAGYTVAIRIIMFTLLPSWGVSNAAATLVGQNLGAGKPERAERSVWLSALANAVFLVLAAVVFIVFAEFFIGLFTGESNVIAVGADCLRILSYGYLLYAVGMVIVQAFNGAGDTATPTAINFFCFWMLELPLAYLLALRLGMEERGVFTAIVIAESMMTIVGTIIFRRGRWKTRQV